MKLNGYYLFSMFLLTLSMIQRKDTLLYAECCNF